MRANTKRGRPRWTPSDENLQSLEEWASRGLTKDQIAASLGVSTDTLQRRKKDFAAFAEHIKKGRAIGVRTIANASFEAAKKGNITAQIFFLKCRGGWRETDPVDLFAAKVFQANASEPPIREAELPMMLEPFAEAVRALCADDPTNADYLTLLKNVDPGNGKVESSRRS